MNGINDFHRREILKQMGVVGAAFGAGPLYGMGRSSNMIWVEAQSFADKGGWVVDQQFMDQMGAPYLLARGMGVPCKDATTSVKVPELGASPAVGVARFGNPTLKLPPSRVALWRDRSAMQGGASPSILFELSCSKSSCLNSTRTVNRTVAPAPMPRI